MIAQAEFREGCRLSNTVSVLIDGTAIPSKLGGVGRYLEGLVQGLDEAGSRFTVVVRHEHVRRFRDLTASANIIEAPRLVDNRLLRFVWEQVGLPRLRRRLRADVLHSPHYTFPFLARRRVVTLHDATFFSDPAAHGRVKRLFFSFWIRQAARRRLTCVVPSAATASEVRRFVPGVRAALLVAPHGVDLDLFAPPSASDVDTVREAIGLPVGAPWIAFLGTIEPRKNVASLVGAHQMVRSRLGPDATPDLVVAGARGWDDAAARALDSVTPDDGVHEVGYLPYASLPAFLGGATLVAYPSSAEGFGLPVLEAMACGACVVTTRRTSLPEVGGDAVAYAEPDTVALADALETLVRDAPRRDALGLAARERASTFTWSRTARIHLDAYREAL